LVELGHTSIGIAAGQANLTSTIHRIEGIRTVVEAAGGHVHVAHALPDREGGRRAARQLLDQEPALTAIVGTADQLAIGAMHWLQDQGIAVADDVSVAGFNDIPAALDVRPTLTTVRLPLRDMGAAALNLGLGGRTAANTSTEFKPELVVRGSTRHRDASASTTATTPTMSATGTGETPVRAKSRISRQAGSK
ncbi:MAG: substrate-binding domain-containing protein, partial [Propionibacteriaceae bacterium]|nr:substrate-binding domain-containing protein [Propionibacteriaceae bacterium]